MGQFFTDDLDALIRSGHGDSERLSRIKADFQAKKLVTLEDRRYVEGLILRYLNPQAPMESERIVKIPEKRIVPPPSQPPRSNQFEMKYQQTPKEEKQIPKIGGKMNMKNIAIAVCAVIVAIAAVSYAAMNQDQGIGTITPAAKSLELDSASYARGDLISISGKVRVPTSIVGLSIVNPSGQEIWTETVTVKSDDVFSTLAIAGGPGWEQSGEYSVSATYSGISDTLTFDFTSSAAN